MNIRAAAVSPSADRAVEARRQLHAWFAAVSLLLALVLLYGFYQVTQQAVARAHLHWKQAPVARTAAVDTCAPGVADCLRLH